MVLVCLPLVAPSHGLIIPLWLGMCLGFSFPGGPWASPEFQVKMEMKGYPWVLNQRNRRGRKGGGQGGQATEVIPGSRGKDIVTKQNLFPVLKDYCYYQ